MSVLDALPDGITGIDTYMGGASEITAGFLVAGERPALIETGPAKVAGAIADGVARTGLDPADLAWIVVTHIHLDHAGGVGDLVRTFPNATVVVHPAGARHLVDPERFELLNSYESNAAGLLRWIRQRQARAAEG